MLTLPPAATRLIANRYASHPELERAAAGYAAALLEKWRGAVAQESYNEALSLKSAHAQSCLYARAERLGSPMTYGDLSRFIAAMTSTPGLLAAFHRADVLASGHPKEVAADEARACARAGGL